MTRLWNDPTRFREDMLRGFAAAHAHAVTATPGGVIRRTRDPEPTVAVVIGGGSGHYPAFAGLVGPGLAHGAVMGNIFASPSAQQVESIVQAVEDGRGVLLSYGNYAGDVLNFDQAQAALRGRGLDVRTVTVTDDIGSAPAGQEHLRRGIAGDLAVFKIAGAAAATGCAIDDVATLARRANDRTRSLGVAFGGCTLPGADRPLFTVPDGMMAVGMGIHGEPGLEELPVPSADELAELFVERLLAEPPSSQGVAGARIVPLLNGLGGIGDEELYVVYGTVDRLLRERGAVPVAPQVGQLCTSFDMSGVSLTLLWLDDELERLWLAPAESPAFRMGNVDDAGERVTAAVQDVTADDEPADEVDPRGVLTVLTAVRDAVNAGADHLGELDAVAGDGDHGIGMSRGANAAADVAELAVAEGVGARTALRRAADAWSNAAGGTSGALWSLMLRAVAARITDSIVTVNDAADAVASARDAVMVAGGAQLGDKTMVDAIAPFARELAEQADRGTPLADAWRQAAGVANDSAQATANLSPKRGRSRTHGDRALGTPDPGAVSFAMIVEAIGSALTPEEGRS